MRLLIGAILTFALSGGVLAGCASGGSSLQPSAATAPSQSGALPDAAGARSLVYVSDQLQKSVLAFPASEHAKNPAPSETLDLGVIPEGVWVDRAGILYVALFPKDPSQFGKIEEFKPGMTSPFRTITDGIGAPSFLVVDQKGTLYVDQTYDLSVQILEYPAGKTSPSVTFQITEKGEGFGGPMTLDAHGNLYVHTFFIDNPPSKVYRFQRGQTKPQDLQLSGLGDATGLTSDKFGNLYVADAKGGISVYASGQQSPNREILPPSNSLFGDFVATRSGKLYVAQGESPSAASLLEYALGGAQPVNVLSGHLRAPLVPALQAAAF
ncbi:MAG TPA: hypothetical protein VEW74_00930 [Candidatus Nitrosotalea sp.]|nr:hypothetical protein [Candidatus Nitrosotalea sp.]